MRPTESYFQSDSPPWKSLLEAFPRPPEVFPEFIKELDRSTASQALRAGISWDDSLQNLLEISLGTNRKGEIKFIRHQDGSQDILMNYFPEANSNLFINHPEPYSQSLCEHCYQNPRHDKNDKPILDLLGEKNDFGVKLSEIFKNSTIIDLGSGEKQYSFQPRMFAELWDAKQYIGVDLFNSNHIVRGEFGIRSNFQSIFLKADIENFLEHCKVSNQKKVFVLMGIEKNWNQERNSPLKNIIKNIKRLMQPGDYLLCDARCTDSAFNFARNGFKLYASEGNYAKDCIYTLSS